ncbi:MAG TPA: HupE/UreJ family protein [Kofleriaceae bacterium]|nr:HupE/UreJ family protein [Kofleriaceae bacterium]
MIKVLVSLVVVCTAATAWAHKPSDSHLRLRVDGTAVTGELAVAIRDLDAAIALDADGNGEITWGEARAATPRIERYVEDRLALASGGEPCALALGTAALTDLSDGAYWAQPITATCAHAPAQLAPAQLAPAQLTIEYRLLFDVDAQHRGLVHVGHQTVIVREPARMIVPLDGGTSVLSFVREGIWHIWLGFDHVLFLICLILPAVFPRRGSTRRWQPAESLRDVGREVLEIVTAFTLAHSITLVISAVGFVTLPSRFVETAIALSVVAAALNNLVRAIDARWAVAFALGLLHGFGFSSVLVDLGLPSSELVGSLIGFNVGVELGQAAIVVVLLPVLYLIRRTLAYQALLWVGSSAVALLALTWSYQRWFV